jgi:hypothetical protein
MDYSHYMVCALLGGGPALAFFFFLRAKRRAWIPPLAWWLSIGLGVVICFYGMSHSTTPSFSSRITAVGEAYNYVEREIHTSYHHDTVYGFRFVPEGGAPINIETEIILPDWGSPADFDGRIFRIVYLNDSKRVLKNEAVEITILSGKHAGFHDSLDARPFGSWLAIPIGAAFATFGFAGLRYVKDDADAAASDDSSDAVESR